MSGVGLSVRIWFTFVSLWFEATHSGLDKNLESPSASDRKVKQFLALDSGHERVNLVSGNPVNLLWHTLCANFVRSLLIWIKTEFYLWFSSLRIIRISFLAKLHKDPITSLFHKFRGLWRGLLWQQLNFLMRKLEWAKTFQREEKKLH